MRGKNEGRKASQQTKNQTRRKESSRNVFLQLCPVLSLLYAPLRHNTITEGAACEGGVPATTRGGGELMYGSIHQCQIRTRKF